ncbi:MAG: hypothetical protein IPM18_17295 [Phycisphaerales bacterium]|nr:hypothetical protein [Phycisphaerales bacterium]
MRLRRIGFFNDMPLEVASKTLAELVRPVAAPDEDRCITYLESGHIFLLCPGIARDAVDAGHPIIGPPNVLTDGTWAWTADVPHYVRRHHMRLPEDFIEWMEHVGWQVPKEIDFSALEL